jgi:replicative DNA helicase
MKRDDRRPERKRALFNSDAPTRTLFDPEAEQRVLACAILKPDCLDELQLVLRPADFGEAAHREAYEHILAKYEAGQAVDSVLLPKLRELLGDTTLAEMARMVPTVANARYYGQQVHVIGNLYQRAIDVAEETVSRGPSTLEIYRDTMAQHEAEAEDWGLLTGIDRLDAHVNGFRPGQFVICAGRPSMGKTALAITIACQLVFRQNYRVALFSLEMTAREVMQRVLSQMCHIPLRAIIAKDTSDGEKKRLRAFEEKIERCGLEIRDDPTLRISQIGAHCRRFLRSGGLDLAVIDYLQLVEPDNTRDPREQQVAKMSRQLKILARQLNVPIICCAQLNRECEGRKDNRPRLSDLRESGSLEQDADVVLLLHRPEYYDEHNPELRGKAEIHTAKNRNGRVGVTEAAWAGMYATFSNLERHHVEGF